MAFRRSRLAKWWRLRVLIDTQYFRIAEIVSKVTFVNPLFEHVETWIFDLDNSLYPPSAGLFAHMDKRMTAYIARLLGLDLDEARRTQKSYFHAHGTTLAGLMHHHGVDPHHFLEDVHALPLDCLVPVPELAARIARLPGEKLVFTNGDTPYARRVLEALKLADAFDGIHDIHACAYCPKPSAESYASLLDRFGFDPSRALFVEDMAQNLEPAKALGMTTVWVNNGSERGSHRACASFIDYEIGDVSAWLGEILGEDQCKTSSTKPGTSATA